MGNLLTEEQNRQPQQRPMQSFDASFNPPEGIYIPPRPDDRRVSQSFANALDLTEEDAKRLNHEGIWALVETRRMGIDKVKKLTSEQVEILDNPKVLGLLGITIDHPRSLGRTRQGVTTHTEQPLEATFIEDKAFLYVDRALTVSPQIISLIPDKGLDSVYYEYYIKGLTRAIFADALFNASLDDAKLILLGKGSELLKQTVEVQLKKPAGDLSTSAVERLLNPPPINRPGIPEKPDWPTATRWIKQYA